MARGGEAVAQPTLEFLTSEGPVEELAKRGVTLAIGVDTVDHIGEAVEIIGREHFPLQHREIELDLIEPTCVHGCVHDDDSRVADAEFVSRAVATMG